MYDLSRATIRPLFTTLTILLFASTAALAQSVRSGSISGTIADETGAALPGVTITLTGSALQVPELVRASEARGEYQFVDLPPGAYRVEYELSGFAKFVRSEIRLTTGFAARGYRHEARQRRRDGHRQRRDPARRRNEHSRRHHGFEGTPGGDAEQSQLSGHVSARRRRAGAWRAAHR